MINKLALVFLFSIISFQYVASQVILKVEPKPEKGEFISVGKEVFKDRNKIILGNGLTVFIKEDHTQKDILGAVVVRGGAKLDPVDATGTAHYFEHMMFKGSTTLGTKDYISEKVYLDSIRDQYELLRLDKDNQEFRAAILKKIDRLSVKAAQYAIPNEFSKVMSSIGATGVNAYTTYENIVYHNSFPKQSIEQWVKLYVDRFQNPVFRLFQSELETVYEEKNRSMDNVFRVVMEEVYKGFYPKSIYGQKTVLGTVEDLKNPSIVSMETYFKDNYNANNMALVLIGDFETDEIIELLNSKFGRIRDGRKAVIPSMQEDAFDGRLVIKKRLSPIAFGVLGFRTVKISHDDEIILDVIAKLLTNNENTGLIDTLSVNSKLLEAQVLQDKHYDKSGMFIFYVPKPVIQSVSNGEKLIMKQIEKLKKGDFDDQLLIAVKSSMLREELLSREQSRHILSNIINSYMSEKEYVEREFILNLEMVNKAEIIRVANLYLGDNYLSFQSKVGFPKKELMDKPNNTPLNIEDEKAQSVMAKKIENMPIHEVNPYYIEFDKDIIITDLRENLHLYYVENPLNNIFSINIRVAMGELQEPKVEALAYYLNNAGVGKYSNVDFKKKMQLYGSSVYFFSTRDYFTIKVYGFDNKLDQTLSDLGDLLSNFSEDKKIIGKLVKDNKMEYKIIKKDLNSKIGFLNEYALYGSQSMYLNRLTNKEIKKLDYSSIKELMNRVLSKQTYIHFVGRSNLELLSSYISNNIPFSKTLLRGNSPFLRDLTTYTQSRFLFLEDNDALQSHIRITIPGNRLEQDGRDILKPYNYYFGVGMNSVMFREIREYRSLAYSAYAYYSVPYRFDKKGYFNAAMSTQADKTNESIELLENLILKMPINEDQIKSLRSFLVRSFNSDMPSFRTKSFAVQYWKQQGYNSDPRVYSYPVYQRIDIEKIIDFHHLNVGGKKSTTSIVGNSKRFDIEKIKIGKQYKKLKLKDIYRY